MTAPDRHITVTSGLRGYYAVSVERTPDGLWEPIDIGMFAYDDFASAERDAKIWAKNEKLEYRPPNSGKPLSFFQSNPVIPAGYMALVKLTDTGPDSFWYGRMAEVPADSMGEADEAHVNPATYEQLAAKLAATGKGAFFH